MHMTFLELFNCIAIAGLDFPLIMYHKYMYITAHCFFQLVLTQKYNNNNNNNNDNDNLVCILIKGRI